MQVGRTLGPTMRREQGILAQQAQNARPRDTDTAQDAQSRPDLAVTLAGERRGLQVARITGPIALFGWLVQVGPAEVRRCPLVGLFCGIIAGSRANAA
jgi:hypothetical protein